MPPIHIVLSPCHQPARFTVPGPISVIMHNRWTKTLDVSSLCTTWIGSWVAPAVTTILFWFYLQATPGKMLLSLSLVDASTEKRPSLSQLVGRYFAYIVSTLPLVLASSGLHGTAKSRAGTINWPTRSSSGKSDTRSLSGLMKHSNSLSICTAYNQDASPIPLLCTAMIQVVFQPEYDSKPYYTNRFVPHHGAVDFHKESFETHLTGRSCIFY